MQKELKAHLFVLLATFLVAGSFIVSKKISGIIDPISITLYRFVIASIVLAPFILLIKKFRVKIFSSFKRAMVISFFYSSFFIGMFKALEFTSALNTGTIYTLVPLLTAIFAFFVFKQEITIKSFFVYFIGIIGTLTVVFKGDLSLFISLSLNYGDIIFLFSIFFMASYSICAKYFYKEDDELLVIVFLTLLGGCIWMFLALLLFDIPLQWEKITGDNYFYLLYLSLLTTLGTVFLYQSGTVILGPKKVMAYVYLNPAAVALLLFLFQGVLINTYMLLGIFISCIATFILLKNKT